VRAQVPLFTANATAETYRKDVLVTKLSGRKEMEDAFGAFLKTNCLRGEVALRDRFLEL
jgi:hypothetical protein